MNPYIDFEFDFDELQYMNADEKLRSAQYHMNRSCELSSLAIKKRQRQNDNAIVTNEIEQINAAANDAMNTAKRIFESMNADIANPGEFHTTSLLLR